MEIWPVHRPELCVLVKMSNIKYKNYFEVSDFIQKKKKEAT